MAVSKEILNEKNYICSLRNYFHENPELSGNEYNTALKIEEELDKLNIPHYRVGNTGVIGIIENDSRKSQITYALRADTDALKITEQNNIPYKSKNNGIMHACGHDGHIASLLGAAKIINNYKNELNVNVKLLFQQEEETGSGAKQFLATKHLNNVDRIIGIHFASFLPVGKVLVQNGESNASCDYFKIVVKGKSCHASKPHEGIDALYIASQIVISLQSIVSRLTNPLDPVVVGIGKMIAGTNYNIMANEAVLEGTTRAFNSKTRNIVNENVKEIALSIANLHGAKADIEIVDYASPLINDKDVVKEAANVLSEIIGIDNAILDAPKNMMADDFAEYLKEIKGCYCFVGSSNGEKTSYPHHHENFDLDEESLLIAANIFSDYVLNYPNKNERSWC